MGALFDAADIDHEAASSQEKVPAAKLHVLQLEPIKAKLGGKWEKLSALVHTLFEKSLRRAQGPQDHFLLVDEMSYVVTFHNLSLAEASLACASVAKEVCDMLFGADVDDITIRGLVGLVPPAMLENAAAAKGIQITEFLERTGGEIIVTHRHVAGEQELFASLPSLVAFCRCAIDIRNVDVGAASAQGVLVTQASAGFIPATAEWVLGSMIDLGRHISTSSADYHAGRVPPSVMGRQLNGAILGVIGYGQIGRYLCEMALALRMRVLVADPYVKVVNGALAQVGLAHKLGAFQVGAAQIGTAQAGTPQVGVAQVGTEQTATV